MVRVTRQFADDFALVTRNWPCEEQELARKVARDAIARGDMSPMETFRLTAEEMGPPDRRRQ